MQGFRESMRWRKKTVDRTWYLALERVTRSSQWEADRLDGR